MAKEYSSEWVDSFVLTHSSRGGRAGCFCFGAAMHNADAVGIRVQVLRVHVQFQRFGNIPRTLTLLGYMVTLCLMF